jgi:glycosyltransferase involved in cell wall biosynthesis
VKVHRLPLIARKKSRISLIRNYLSFWRNAKHYLSHLKDEYDLVYSMSMSPLISVEGGGIYAKKHGKPHVIHCLDLWPESAVIAGKVRKNSLLYRILYRSSKKIYSSADEILISSPSFALYFKDVLKLPDKKGFLCATAASRESFARKGVAFPKRYNLVYAGNIGNLQLIENYVKACALLKGSKRLPIPYRRRGRPAQCRSSFDRRKPLEDLVVYHPLVSAAEVPVLFHERDRSSRSFGGYLFAGFEDDSEQTDFFFGLFAPDPRLDRRRWPGRSDSSRGRSLCQRRSERYRSHD